ncbi:hypothetical protein HY627_02005 [Candidatus Uhrbacteria bacterium]|nr:hypothetical protein [Candidatus Uhrbacteria bacterium]
MPTLQEVSSDHILKTVMVAVRSARRLIRATIDLDEEVRKPLPEEYFLLLQQKLAQGVHLYRVGFGSDEAISLFLQQQPFSHHRYRFYINKKDPYRRMILIDDRILFFARQEQNSRRFFTTDDPQSIADALFYFTHVSNSGDVQSTEPSPTAL